MLAASIFNLKHAASLISPSAAITCSLGAPYGKKALLKNLISSLKLTSRDTTPNQRAFRLHNTQSVPFPLQISSEIWG